MLDGPTSTPRLERRARLRWDAVRATHVLLAPENVLRLSRTAGEALALCDGTRTRADVIAALEARYPGAPVATDVNALLDRLVLRGFVIEPGATRSTSVAATSDEHPAVRSETRAGDPPVALVAELTYRCPLRCGYCANPVDLARYRDELDTHSWRRVLTEAAALGVYHAHFSGGEPLLRADLEDLVAHARAAGLYTNLITSAYDLDDARVDRLAAAGLDHAQVSFQHVDGARADRIAGTVVHAAKLRAAAAIRARDIALSVNVVLHRGNLAHTGELIGLAESLGATRIELANTQYHGWALANRDALLPTREALDVAASVADAARARLRGRMDVLFVRPDYYTDSPKPCTDGWGRRFVTVIPDGTVLPCAGAHALPLAFDTVRARSLGDIWRESPALAAFRGTGWMPEPCATCDRREIDFGGCRCQAYALTGDMRATDPACVRSPRHDLVASARESARRDPPEVLYRLGGRTRG
ncbi:MAG: pyrroloquinoline quinone biosynthesis protein PqqE [Deltaproteobacteria bacterium]